MRKIASVYPLEANTIAVCVSSSFFLLHFKESDTKTSWCGRGQSESGIFPSCFFCTIAMLSLHYSTCTDCSFFPQPG